MSRGTLCFVLFLGAIFVLPARSQPPVRLLLSWNLRPYWEFAEGFRSTRFFRVHISLLREDFQPDFRENPLPVGHRALGFIRQAGFEGPLFAALILHPSLLGPREAQGGIYLLPPPGDFFPRLKNVLSAHDLSVRRIGIPYTSPSLKRFLEEIRKEASSYGFQVNLLPLTGFEAFRRELAGLDLVFFVPDPFLESEGVISRLVKTTVLSGRLAIGYNRFFLEKGAHFALIIDYRGAGREGAKLFREFLAGARKWTPAPFHIEENKKALRFYQLRKSSNSTKKTSSPGRE